MKNRYIAFFICIMLLFTSACSQTDVNKSSGGVTTIKVWSNAGATKDTMTKMVNDFNNTDGKDKGIKIEYTVYGDDYATITDLAFQNNQAPEILKVNGSKEPYAAKGDIIPLNDLPGGEDFLKEYGTQPLEGDDTFGGKTYFVPAEVTTTGIVYNKDLFKKAGIVDENGEALPPKTWDEVREYAKRLTDTKNMVYGISLPLKFGGFHDYIINRPFSASFEGSDVLKIDFDNLKYDFSNFKNVYEWMLAVKNDGSYFPGAESLDNDASRAQFAEGRIGMILSQSWDMGVLTTQFVANCDWGVAPTPVLEADKRYPTNEMVSGLFCVSKSASNSNLEKVMEVYKLFHSFELQKTLYENGLSIPYRTSVIEAADKTNMPPQWTAYGSLVNKNYKRKVSVPLKLEGERINDLTLKVWAGTISIDDCIKDANNRYSTALKNGVENGTIDIEFFKKY